MSKRAFDLVVSTLALILLFPVLMLLALLVRLKLGSPVLFRQQRPGLRGKPFTLCKFRTMTDARDVAGDLLPDAEQVGQIIARAGHAMDQVKPDRLLILGDTNSGLAAIGAAFPSSIWRLATGVTMTPYPKRSIGASLTIAAPY